MIDCIVKRSELKEKLIYFVSFLTGNSAHPKLKDKSRDKEKLDELIAFSQKERERNAINVKQT